MLARVTKCLAAVAAVLLLGGAGQSCGEPGRLCASAAPVASAPQRIVLMLPLRADGLRDAAEAVRDGFMTAWQRDQAGFTVEVVETGGGQQEALDAYRAAVDKADLVVGPLARSAVAAVAASPAAGKPTIALNTPGPDAAPLPAHMLSIGLSLDEDARRIADWADNALPQGKALIVSGAAPWQRRVAAAFLAQWRGLGRAAADLELDTSLGRIADDSLAQLPQLVQQEKIALVFVALEPEQAREVRGACGVDLPFFATAAANPGRNPGLPLVELNGMRLLDLPWELQPDHPAVMAYPRRPVYELAPDLDRLYALGIDSYRLARELLLHPGQPVRLDGVTGLLSVRPANGVLHFERRASTATYRLGGFDNVSAIP
ncbi:MAG TPA: penicillin-binding protein activator [Telluria sp.]|nr:penicillin-binding protein activator [Telluria sp.]